MNFLKSKSIVSQLLFTMCIGVPYLNIYELTFLVWIVTILFTIKKKYSLTIVQYVFPYIGVIVVAAFSMFFFEQHLYEIIRDITYLLKPILGLILGYQLCRSVNAKAIETIIYAGLFISIIHFIIIFCAAINHRIININILREFSGYFSDFEVYSVILVIFHKQFEVSLSKQRYWFLLLTIGLSSLLYVSRTNFIQFGLFYLVLKGYFTLNKKTIIILISTIFITSIGYSIIYNMKLSRAGSGLEAILYKIKNAPIEAFKTKIDKNDWQDFNDNFRSFENIITVKQVTDSGTYAVIAGKGLGATIDLGRRVYTNDYTYVQHEAILHNTFMTVFLKSGLIGVFLMLYSLYIMVKQKKSNINIIKQINLLFFATGVFLLFENWVLLGLFLKTEGKSVLIGFLLAYRELLLKQHSQSQISN